MKADQIQVVEPRKAELTASDFEDEVSHDHEVIVETEVTLISPGTELAYYTNKNPQGANRYPGGLGYANVGRVVAVGDAVETLQPGDRVFSHTGHASMTRFDTRQRVHLKLPAEISSEAAVFIRMATVSMTTLRVCRAKPGDYLAVFGLGLVGNLASQIFQASGLNVTGFDPSEGRRAIASRCGLQHFLPVPIEDADAVINRYTDGRGFHLLIDAAGRPEAFCEAVKVARQGAEIFLIALNWSKETSVLATELLQPIFHKYLTVRSGWEWQIPLFDAGVHTPHTMIQNSQHALDLIQSKRINVTGLITDRMSATEAQTAYQGLLNQPDAHLGVVLDWTAL